ncbi:hypothetical protein [Paenibacillus sp. FSL R7-0333]|uniref:hypothetical protein n=1 Tax=Paenibacillus sp. FSL R7-0333 TaxID=1926587 RepID=UPI00096EAF90|nr:hypothetical protein BK146_17810 [Paenibacillus sp. FSL R7-0333]
MNKLNKQISLNTIKERVKSFNDDPNLYGVVMTVWEMNLLLELLEEKNKALAFYENIENWTPYPNSLDYECKILDDCGNIARKALNTSSNNEGETI